MVEADNQEAPPLCLKQGFKQDLRMLIAQKQYLFSWAHTNIPNSDLIGIGFQNVLRIATGAGTTEEIEILAWPNPTGLPLIVEHLRVVQSDTAAEVGLLEQASRVPGSHRYGGNPDDGGVLRATADLVGYQRIFTVWRYTQPAASFKRVIVHWLNERKKNDADTKAVLNISVSCR